MSRSASQFLKFLRHPALRKKMLSGDAAIVFSSGITNALFANAAGAGLFGGSTIAQLQGAPLASSQPLVRQLRDAEAQLAGDETVVRDFRVPFGLRHEFVQCEMQRLELLDDATAILLTSADSRFFKPVREHELARQTLASLEGMASASAITDEYGLPVAIGTGFAQLDLGEEEIAALAHSAAQAADGIATARAQYAGTDLAMTLLRRHPDRYLLLAADDLIPTETTSGESVAAAEMTAEPELFTEPDAMVTDDRQATLEQETVEDGEAVSLVDHAVTDESLPAGDDSERYDVTSLEGEEAVADAASEVALTDDIAAADDQPSFHVKEEPSAEERETAWDSGHEEELTALPSSEGAPESDQHETAEIEQASVGELDNRDIASSELPAESSATTLSTEAAVSTAAGAVAATSLLERWYRRLAGRNEEVPAASFEEVSGGSHTIHTDAAESASADDAAQSVSDDEVAKLAADDDLAAVDANTEDHAWEQVTDGAEDPSTDEQARGEYQQAADNSEADAPSEFVDDLGSDEAANVNEHPVDVEENEDAAYHATSDGNGRLEGEGDDVSAESRDWTDEAEVETHLETVDTAVPEMSSAEAEAFAAARADDRDTDETDAFIFRPDGDPVRFAWIVDNNQIFRSVSPELAKTVGPSAADIVGRRWQDVAAVFGFDGNGDIRRLFDKRDTWSGRSVLWPIQGTDLAVPVDLAALPVFDASRNFDGFRGFGIIRTADAVVDPDEIGFALDPSFRPPAIDETEESRVEQRVLAADDFGDESGNTQQVPLQANVVDLASRRRNEASETPSSGETLSSGETQAFQEIARTLTGTESDRTEVDESLAGSAETGASDLPASEGFPDELDADIAMEASDRAHYQGWTEAEAEHVEDQESHVPVSPEAATGSQANDLLANIPSPVLVYRNGQTLYANAELLDISGYATVGEIEAAGGVEALLGAEPSLGGGARLKLRRRDGDQIDIAPVLHSVPWEDGKALLLTFRSHGAESADAQKIAIDVARVSELQSILDTAADGIIVIGRDGMTESFNHSAEALFGCSFDDAVRRPVTDFFAQESHRLISDYIDQMDEPGVGGLINEGREAIGKEAKGGLIPLFVTLGRIGTSGKLCMVLRDLTPWKKAREELVSARRTAEAASEQKTDFLTRVSHEIRTPLTAIIGFSDVMLEERFGPIGNERYRDYLRDINRSGVHVLDLINDLLDISKIEAGKMELSFEAVDLNQLAAETVALLQPQANRERIIIRTSLSRAVPRVVADARSVRQIILNLVSNAIKYTPENGQVIVSTVYEGNGEVSMRVRDTGAGMSRDEVELALKPFQQVGDRRGLGTGLGLPLTKALVEANRAYFALESTPGEGTIAEIHFPTQRVLAD